MQWFVFDDNHDLSHDLSQSQNHDLSHDLSQSQNYDFMESTWSHDFDLSQNFMTLT